MNVAGVVMQLSENNVAEQELSGEAPRQVSENEYSWRGNAGILNECCWTGSIWRGAQTGSENECSWRGNACI